MSQPGNGSCPNPGGSNPGGEEGEGEGMSMGNGSGSAMQQIFKSDQCCRLQTAGY